MENPIFLDAESFEKSFNLRIEPKLKTKEKIFLDKFIKKIDSNMPITFFPLGELYSIYRSKDISYIKNELLKLGRKKMFFILTTIEQEKIQGEFFLLNSIHIKNDGIYIAPPLELIYSLNKESIFNKIDLLTFIRFKERHTFRFYPKVIQYYDRKKFEYTVPQLKEIFGVENDYYERFYDFEKNVIKPIINDINKSSHMKISYEKIKDGLGKTNKIISLKFSLVDLKKAKINNSTNLVIHSIKNNVKDISSITKLIEKSFLNMESENVFKLVNKVTTTFDAPIDIFLEAALESKYRLKEDRIKIVDIQEKFNSTFKIEARLYKELAIFNFSYNYHFLKELQNLRVSNIFNYDIAPWKIRVKYQPKTTSSIKIYLNLED
jgi:hypothetical protein